MACEYCDFKVPQPDTPYRVGNAPIGRPLSKRWDEYYNDFIALCHDDGSRCNPPLDIDQYIIVWDRSGNGFYASINYCPMCGRDLREDNHD